MGVSQSSNCCCLRQRVNKRLIVFVLQCALTSALHTAGCIFIAPSARTKPLQVCSEQFSRQPFSSFPLKGEENKKTSPKHHLTPSRAFVIFIDFSMCKSSEAQVETALCRLSARVNRRQLLLALVQARQATQKT